MKSTKLQAPNNKQISISKIPNSKQNHFGHWNLEIVWDLEFGNWNLIPWM
jgi:hypothetical protein